MASKRRKEYLPISNPLYRIYHERFDFYRMHSNILNPESRPSIHTTFNDKRSITGLLVEIIGDADGRYRRENATYIARIPGVRQKLSTIELEWQRRQQQYINSGYEIPEQMDSDLWEQKLTSEAALDIYAEERELLEQRLATYKDKETEVEDANMLRRGLIQVSHLWGFRDITKLDILHDIDGQLCDFINNTLCITSKKSPYYGMSVSNYRKLSKLWRADMQKRNDEKLIELQQAAKERGEPKPYSLPMRQTIFSLNELPPWPSFAKNHLHGVGGVVHKTASLFKKK